MHRITESVEICRPVETVFTFLRDFESRVRLNPVWNVVRYEASPSGKAREGMQYRVAVDVDGKEFLHEGKVVAMIENDKIGSAALDGSMQLELTVQKIPIGTLLIHDEKFIIPEEAFSHEDEKPIPLWLKVIHGIFSLESPAKIRAKKIRNIQQNLRETLREWLWNIKQELETENNA
jgi:hypothetical protein